MHCTSHPPPLQGAIQPPLYVVAYWATAAVAYRAAGLLPSRLTPGPLSALAYSLAIAAGPASGEHRPALPCLDWT